MDTPRSDDLSMTSMQVVELKRKLDEERDGYRRKLQSYQEGQQRQAQLVQKLQSKVCLNFIISGWEVTTRPFMDEDVVQNRYFTGSKLRL